jgi:hypothetical protein
VGKLIRVRRLPSFRLAWADRLAQLSYGFADPQAGQTVVGDLVQLDLPPPNRDLHGSGTSGLHQALQTTIECVVVNAIMYLLLGALLQVPETIGMFREESKDDQVKFEPEKIRQLHIEINIHHAVPP